MIISSAHVAHVTENCSFYLYTQLGRVLSGDLIAIDYRNILSTSIAIFYSWPNGDPMLDTAPEPFLRYYNPVAIGMPKENPWMKTFDGIIAKMKQAGEK